MLLLVSFYLLACKLQVVVSTAVGVSEAASHTRTLLLCLPCSVTRLGSQGSFLWHVFAPDNPTVLFVKLQCRLEFSKAVGAGVDAMARSDNLDDYVVFDPLLEAAKGKFSRAAQKEKKKQTQWAGRGQG